MSLSNYTHEYKVRRRVSGAPITIDYFLERSIPEPNSGCWLWLGAVNKDGYGSIRVEGRSQGAHRVSIAITERLDLSSGFVARHTCDNTFCVNPEHLVAGSIKDNVHDCMRRGRDRRPFQHGAKGPRAVLTEKEVLEIRSLSGMSHEAIAAIYGVNRSTISMIIRRDTWAFT